GVYSFDAGDGNTVLGLQPIGSDFTPGDITLRLENTSGGTAEELIIRYSIFVYNDQGRSSSFNFSYSPDDGAYTQIPSADYTTPETADSSPEWQEVTREFSIPAVNLANNDVIYLQWSTDDVGGSGSRDEFGLTNIEIEIQNAPADTEELLGEFEIDYEDINNNSQSSNTAEGISFTDVDHTSATNVLLRTGSDFDEPFFQTGSGWTETSRADANNFFFDIQAGEGFLFSPTEISFKARRTGTGPPDIGIDVRHSDGTALFESDDISLPDGDIQDITISINDVASVDSVQVQIRGWNASGTGPLQISELSVRGTIEEPQQYEWVGGSGNFSESANWLPNRPDDAGAAGQVLEFKNGEENTISLGNADLSELGALRITNNTNVTFTGSSTPDVTLTGIATQPQALFVESGSTLSLENDFDLRLGPNQDGRVEGTLELATNDNIRILIDEQAGELRFLDGGLLIANGSSGAFGDAVADSKTEGVIFESGSEFRYQRGGDPFGSSTSPSLVMQPGSLFNVTGTASTFRVEGYTYADVKFERDQDRDVAQDGFTADNLIIDTPDVTFNIDGDVVINGDITINEGNTLRFGKADDDRTPLFRFEGDEGLQRIQGEGSFVMEENATLRITNADNLASSMDISLNGTYDPQDGVLFMEDGASLTTFAPEGAKSTKSAPDLEITGNRGWRMLSAPVSDMLVSDLEAQNHVQGVSGNAFSEGEANLAFRREDGSDYSWQAPENLSDPLPSGEGFIWFFYDEADFPGGNSPIGSTFQELPFTLSTNGKTSQAPGDTDAPLNVGDLNDFSLVGNPYTQPISTEFLIGRNGPLPQAVQVWQSGTSGDGGTGSWVPVNTSVSAWQGFVIQGSAAAGGVQADSLIFTNLGKLETGEDFKNDKNEAPETYPALTLELRGHHPETGYRTTDRGNVFYFHPYARNGADLRDTPKLQALNAASAQLGIQATRGGQVQLLSQDARPAELGDELLIPLELLLTNMAGEFEIRWDGLESLPESWTIELVDVEAGQSINLRNQDVYSFEDFSAGMQNAPDAFTLQKPGEGGVIQTQKSSGYARFR
ncbi:MAG: hypothetical protein ACOC2C_07840, partial [Cyclonatronaceae bacterium]